MKGGDADAVVARTAYPFQVDEVTTKASKRTKVEHKEEQVFGGA